MTDTACPKLAQLSEPFPWLRSRLNPPDVYTALRKEQPVAQVKLRNGDSAWLITRYEDVKMVLSDSRVSADNSREGFPVLTEVRPISARVFLRMDPPDHSLYRRLFTNNFVVRRVRAMRPDLERLVDGLIDEILSSEQRPIDLVHKLSLPVPSTVLSWILGAHQEDQEFFNDAAERLLVNGYNATDPEAAGRAMQAAGELVGYVAKLMAEKEASEDPGDDIIGELVQAVRDGLITREEAIANGFIFIVAGHDTTAGMTTLGTLTLLQHPDQMAELQADPSLIPNAVEEMLRYLTIVDQVVLRIAAEDIEVGGQLIRAGEGIIPLINSADRDDERFPNADTFDIHRDTRGHFGFGYGVHQCIGQTLARGELIVVFERLLKRIPTLKLAVPFDDLEFKETASINGVLHLPVTW
jgi:cytochrome P450